ncbi:hypothetical protein [Streptomyces halobius]|uniref:Uncharacterized protein n=1 Tax=Streptomyces halobius TaxID=2879846 RepID=A0ABY4MJB1_9ACTN|nr:hypothetical protein [Streptomyces halobius]UQA97168.1 hypothetical protein K9S39_39625 [Streptomyces halobius]
MGLFRRGPKRDSRDLARDAEFSFFSEREGGVFRSEVRQAFAEQGLEVTVYAGVVADSAGRQFGLGNLAAVCHRDRRGERSWPTLIRDHVGKVLRTMDGPQPLEILSEDEIRACLYPRVVAQESLPEADSFRYGRQPAPGLREVLALDLPEAVQMLSEDSLADLGEVAELRIRAMNNLRALPVEGHETVRRGDGSAFEVLLGDSFFTASRVLVLDELVQRIMGTGLTPDGALVAMPFRHQLAFHPIHDAHVIPALQAMAQFAAAGHKDAAGAISPKVYWWRGGEMTPLCEPDGDGLRVVVDGDFQELLERLVQDDA